jgi:hypothetical protein
VSDLKYLAGISVIWAVVVVYAFFTRQPPPAAQPDRVTALLAPAAPLTVAPPQGWANEDVRIASPIAAAVPLPVVEPSNGDGKQKVFTIRSAAPPGRKLKEVRVLFSDGPDGRKACYLHYDVEQNLFMLVDNAGASSTRLAPGDSGFVANSQCWLDGAGSSVQNSEEGVTVSAALRFNSDFRGSKNIYVYSEMQDGGKSGLQLQGSWTVPSSYLTGTAR